MKNWEIAARADCTAEYARSVLKKNAIASRPPQAANESAPPGPEAAAQNISEPACAYVYVFQNECLYCMYVGVLYIHIQKVHMCAYFYPHVHMSVCACIVCMCMYLKILFLQIHTDIYRYMRYIQYMHIHAK